MLHIRKHSRSPENCNVQNIELMELRAVGLMVCSLCSCPSFSFSSTLSKFFDKHTITPVVMVVYRIRHKFEGANEKKRDREEE